MAPIVHGLESEYFGNINFVYLDIDDPANDEYKKQLGFRYQPHFLLLDGEGRLIEQWIGVVNKETLQSAFDAALE